MTLAASGLALGFALSPLLARVLGSLLFGMAPRDPQTLGRGRARVGARGVPGVLSARAPRAARPDPLVALRCK
jgi:hypothetical protein